MRRKNGCRFFRHLVQISPLHDAIGFYGAAGNTKFLTAVGHTVDACRGLGRMTPDEARILVLNETKSVNLKTYRR
jgi:hypothetical protein